MTGDEVNAAVSQSLESFDDEEQILSYSECTAALRETRGNRGLSASPREETFWEVSLRIRAERSNLVLFKAVVANGVEQNG